MRSGRQTKTMLNSVPDAKIKNKLFKKLKDVPNYQSKKKELFSYIQASVLLFINTSDFSCFVLTFRKV